VELQSAECQSLQPPRVTVTATCTDRSPRRHIDVMSASQRHNDVMSASRRSSAAVSDNDDDNDDDDNSDNDDNAVTSRHAPGSYLRHARMSIYKMTSDYMRRLPSVAARKDRSATRRERKATKTLAIVLGQHISYIFIFIHRKAVEIIVVAKRTNSSSYAVLNLE